MPKLGEFIGALLADAVHARVRADLEAVKIAETYSAHELLKHLPVPRFRLPDITIDVPVLVSSVEGVPPSEGGRPFDKPTPEEIRNIVHKALDESKFSPTPFLTQVSEKAVERARLIFKTGPQSVLSPTRVSSDLAATVVNAMKDALKDQKVDEGNLKALELSAKASLQSLLLTKLVQSPYLQVMVAAAEIKSHANNDSIVRIRLTITEDAYEVINRDDGQGYYFTPE